jgi:hypothetical protein
VCYWSVATVPTVNSPLSWTCYAWWAFRMMNSQQKQAKNLRLFSLLTHGNRYRSTKSKSKRLLNSFYPQATWTPNQMATQNICVAYLPPLFIFSCVPSQTVHRQKAPSYYPIKAILTLSHPWSHYWLKKSNVTQYLPINFQQYCPSVCLVRTVGHHQSVCSQLAMLMIPGILWVDGLSPS